MISPMTPPGTKVVCVKINKGRGLPRLQRGAIYTVAEILEAKPGPFGVHLHETAEAHRWRRVGFLWRKMVRYGYSLACFKRLDLPLCLTNLLKGHPIPKDAFEPKLKPAPSRVKEKEPS